MLHAASTLLVRIPIPRGAAGPIAIIGGILLVILVIYMVGAHRKETWAKVVIAVVVTGVLGSGGFMLYMMHQRDQEQKRRLSFFYNGITEAGAAEGKDLATAPLAEELRRSCSVLSSRLRSDFIAYLLPLPEELRRRHHLEAEPAGVFYHWGELATFRVAGGGELGRYADGTPLPDLSGHDVVVVAAVKELDAVKREATLAVRVYNWMGIGGPKGRLCEGTVSVPLGSEALSTGGPALLRGLGKQALTPLCSYSYPAFCANLTLSR
jgi:hypothetical protein